MGSGLAGFRRDLELVMSNCLAFNEEDSPYYAEALALADAVRPAYEAATGGGGAKRARRR